MITTRTTKLLIANVSLHFDFTRSIAETDGRDALRDVGVFESAFRMHQLDGERPLKALPPVTRLRETLQCVDSWSHALQVAVQSRQADGGQGRRSHHTGHLERTEYHTVNSVFKIDFLLTKFEYE